MGCEEGKLEKKSREAHSMLTVSDSVTQCANSFVALSLLMHLQGVRFSPFGIPTLTLTLTTSAERGYERWGLQEQQSDASGVTVLAWCPWP